MQNRKDSPQVRENVQSKEREKEAKEKNQEDQFEIQAGEYVHKFNEICRQHKLSKPNYKWKYEKVGNKRKVKYYISQDQLDICIKVTDKSKAYAKLQSVKMAYEEAVRLLISKQHQHPIPLDQAPESDSLTAKYHEQIKNLDTLTKADKKELLPALRRAEQDIDVFLDSESKIYAPAKNKSRTGSVESNPIEYAMVRKGHTYFDTTTPVVRAPSPLPSVPPKRPADKLILPAERFPAADKPAPVQATDEAHVKDETDELDASSTLRISSGFAYQPTHMATHNRREIAEDFATKVAATNSLNQLNQVHTIRTRPKLGLQIQADLDIEMLLYLQAQKKLLSEAAERARSETTSSTTNFLRVLNLLLLQNDKISIEIKISSDFGILSKKDPDSKKDSDSKRDSDRRHDSDTKKDSDSFRRQTKESAKTDRGPERGSERGPEKMNGRVEKSYKAMGMKSSEGSIDSIKAKAEQKKPKPSEHSSPPEAKKGRDHSSPPNHATLANVQEPPAPSPAPVPSHAPIPVESKETRDDQIVWLSRLNCFYLDCCFTTVLGSGKTTGKSINDAAIKMIIYLNSLVNFWISHIAPRINRRK